MFKFQKLFFFHFCAFPYECQDNLDTIGTITKPSSFAILKASTEMT